MSTTANATFKITGWDENTWTGQPATDVTGDKLTRAKVTKTYAGDLEATAELEYLMAYHAEHPHGDTHFVGLERVTGKLAGKSGSFVLQYTGTDKNGTVEQTWTVVPGSGTGELVGLRGQGSGSLTHQEEFPFVLAYSFDE